MVIGWDSTSRLITAVSLGISQEAGKLGVVRGCKSRTTFLYEKMNPLLPLLNKLHTFNPLSGSSQPSAENAASSSISAPAVHSLKQMLEWAMVSGLEFALIPALNYVLADAEWASKKLQGHVGKVVCFDFGVFMVRVIITPNGMLALSPESVPVTTIRIKLADIPLILQDKQRAISYVKLDGDADLAQAISELGQHLRWDGEQELSRVVGDIPARRITQAGQSLLHSMARNVQKLQENMAEYLLDENPLLVRPIEVNAFSRDVGRTRDDVERLMKRLENVERVCAQQRAQALKLV